MLVRNVMSLIDSRFLLFEKLRLLSPVDDVPWMFLNLFPPLSRGTLGNWQ